MSTVTPNDNKRSRERHEYTSKTKRRKYLPNEQQEDPPSVSTVDGNANPGVVVPRVDNPDVDDVQVWDATTDIPDLNAMIRLLNSTRKNSINENTQIVRDIRRNNQLTSFLEQCYTQFKGNWMNNPALLVMATVLLHINIRPVQQREKRLADGTKRQETKVEQFKRAKNGHALFIRKYRLPSAYSYEEIPQELTDKVRATIAICYWNYHKKFGVPKEPKLLGNQKFLPNFKQHQAAADRFSLFLTAHLACICYNPRIYHGSLDRLALMDEQCYKMFRAFIQHVLQRYPLQTEKEKPGQRRLKKHIYKPWLFNRQIRWEHIKTIPMHSAYTNLRQRLNDFGIFGEKGAMKLIANKQPLPLKSTGFLPHFLLWDSISEKFRYNSKGQERCTSPKRILSTTENQRYRENFQMHEDPFQYQNGEHEEDAYDTDDSWRSDDGNGEHEEDTDDSSRSDDGCE